jgi:hypothetical protein
MIEPRAKWKTRHAHELETECRKEIVALSTYHPLLSHRNDPYSRIPRVGLVPHHPPLLLLLNGIKRLDLYLLEREERHQWSSKHLQYLMHVMHVLPHDTVWGTEGTDRHLLGNDSPVVQDRVQNDRVIFRFTVELEGLEVGENEFALSCLVKLELNDLRTVERAPVVSDLFDGIKGCSTGVILGNEKFVCGHADHELDFGVDSGLCWGIKRDWELGVGRLGSWRGFLVERCWEGLDAFSQVFDALFQLVR